jgi:hypothetical protein
LKTQLKSLERKEKKSLLTYNSNFGTMGLSFSSIWDRFFALKQARILMIGLDAAGKVGHFRSPS